MVRPQSEHEALKTALNSPTHFDFEDLASLDSVQALSNSDPVHFEMLELFISQMLDDFVDFKEEHDGWVEQLRLLMVSDLDQTSFPVCALLEDDEAWSASDRSDLKYDGTDALPPACCLRVFDGQHRLAAARKVPLQAEQRDGVKRVGALRGVYGVASVQERRTGMRRFV